MSTIPTTSVTLRCDVPDCRSEINSGAPTNEQAREHAERLGWRVRASNLITADFCPSHADRVERSDSIDKMRVYRDPFGDLVYHWPGPGGARRFRIRTTQITARDQIESDWVELVPVGSILQHHDAEIEEVRDDLAAAARVATAYAQDPFPTSLRSRHPELAAALDALLEHRLGR